MARIALDVMGGDHAPHATVAGALLAAQEFEGGHTIQLVGRPDVIQSTLEGMVAGEHAHAAPFVDQFEIVEAPEVIEMADKPSAAIRGKPRSSMVVGLKLQAEGRSDAFVSAGNTGAQMAASTVVLRLHEGLARPAIATLFPTARGEPLVVLDSGANVDCSPQELVQFARLGAVYAHDILGRPEPVVGLLSVGEESEKGNAAVKEAHQLLRQSGLRFQGNVEGRDLPMGASERGPLDVVVCDGFTGNVVLKFYEGVAPMIFGLVMRTGIPKEQLAPVFRHFDYAQYGGAPLLGVKGVSVICHGKSSPLAIKNALHVAARAATTGMSAHMGRALAAGPQAAPESA